MGPDVVVLFKPYIESGLCLFDGSEPLTVEKLSSQCSIKSFVVAVFPKATLDRFEWA